MQSECQRVARLDLFGLPFRMNRLGLLKADSLRKTRSRGNFLSTVWKGCFDFLVTGREASKADEESSYVISFQQQRDNDGDEHQRPVYQHGYEQGSLIEQPACTAIENGTATNLDRREFYTSGAPGRV